jgi:SAM-dependent methyltransferase
VDPITTALQAMYEEFPYPASNAPEQRVGWDVRLLLSYGSRRAPAGKHLVALDAGCGRGVGTLGAATLQPDVQFVGVDVNRVALKEASEQAIARGLKNVRFLEVDLTTLEGLDVPSGGFDAVFSSGVVHHMPDPVAGLRKLRECLAPHGILQLMVYGRHGRTPLDRLARAIDLLIPREAPLRDRLTVGQHLARTFPSDALSAGPWSDLGTVNDAEFVDRYLNVHETSFDVRGVWELLEGAGLRFVRWTEPHEWSVDVLFGKGPLRDMAARLPAREQFALVEQLTWRTKLELVASGHDNDPRAPLAGDELLKATVVVSPEARFRTDVRCVSGSHRIEHLSVEVRRGVNIAITGGPLATAVQVIKERTAPTSGEQLVRTLEKHGLTRAVAIDAVTDLVRAEVLYVS